MQVAQAGGEWSELHCRRERKAAHEEPELTVNHEEVTSLPGLDAAFQAVDLQVKVRRNWTKKVSLNTKELALTMTPRLSTHIVGLIPSVPVLKIYRLSSEQARPN